MIKLKSGRQQPPAVATRALIVQRVLVDGWSAAEAAAVFRVEERQVARWVAAYRRRGMASLRRTPAAAADRPRWLWRVRAFFAPIRVAVGVADEVVPARCVNLPHASDRPPSSQKRL